MSRIWVAELSSDYGPPWPYGQKFRVSTSTLDPGERVRTLASSKYLSHRNLAPHVICARPDLYDDQEFTSTEEAKRAKRNLIERLWAEGHWVNESGTAFHVYVIELSNGVGIKTGRRDLPWLYVGETSKNPRDRILQHKEGAMKGRRRIYNRSAHEHYVCPREDLYGSIPAVFTRGESRQLEAKTALRLETEGYSVIWG